MKEAVQSDIKRTQEVGAKPAQRYRPLQRLAPASRLAELAAMINESPQVQSQLRLSGEIQGRQNANQHASPTAAQKKAHASASVAQREIIVTEAFNEIEPLRKAYGRIAGVVEKDELLSELFKHAQANHSDLTFTIGDLSKDAGVGLTELYINGTKISSKTDFGKLVGQNPAAVIDGKIETLITIDYNRILLAIKDKEAQQPTDVLQILAHEYGVHATKNLLFLNELKQFRGNPQGMVEYFQGATASEGALSGGPQHKTHMREDDKYYNRLSAGLLTDMSESEGQSFTRSEIQDREMQKAVYGKLEPAMKDIGDLKEKTSALDVTPLSFRPAAKKPSPGNRDNCFITTACVRRRGLQDDCEELTVLRGFRDQVLCRFEEGRTLCDLYYRISPGIVAAIAGSGNAAAIYGRLYEIVGYCVDAVQRGDHSAALQAYAGMVVALMQRFPAALHAGKVNRRG